MSKEKYNIIGDVHGRFDLLMELIAKMPLRDFIFVGDLIDRGPNPIEVVDWVIKTRSVCVLGNHEHMMLDFYKQTKRYDFNTWFRNEGDVTFDAYEKDKKTLNDHLNFIDNLPTKFESDHLIVTHAPTIHHDKMNVFDAVWCRRPSKKIPNGKTHIYGHQGMRYEGKNERGIITSICIDNSAVGELIGMTWPEKEYFSVQEK